MCITLFSPLELNYGPFIVVKASLRPLATLHVSSKPLNLSYPERFVAHWTHQIWIERTFSVFNSTFPLPLTCSLTSAATSPMSTLMLVESLFECWSVIKLSRGGSSDIIRFCRSPCGTFRCPCDCCAFVELEA